MLGEGERFGAVAGRHLEQERGFPGRNETNAVVDVEVVPPEPVEGGSGELAEGFFSQSLVTGVAEAEQRAAILDVADDSEKGEHRSVFRVLMGRRRFDWVAGNKAGNQGKTPVDLGSPCLKVQPSRGGN